MAKKKDAALTPPTEENIGSAIELLKARILADLAAIPHLPIGSDAWRGVLERRIDNAVNSGSFLLALKTELMEALPKLAAGGKGPVVHDPVDLA